MFLIDLILRLADMTSERHIREILAEICNNHHYGCNEDPDTEVDKEDVKRKEKILNRISCPNCGTYLKDSFEKCPVCEARKNMERTDLR